jgi:hypothetical protein
VGEILLRFGVTGQTLVPAGPFFALDFILYSPDKSLETTENAQLTLAHVYPNPFIDQLNIEYSTETGGFIEIRCYNTQGEIVEVLLSEMKPAGSHSLQWNSDLPPGIYFLEMTSDGQRFTKKIIKQ